MEEEKKKIYVPKLLAVLCFSIVFSCLAIAIVSDVIIFLNAIVEVVLGVFLCALLFVLCLIAFLASIVLVFGAFIIQNYGFWPLTVTVNFFKEFTKEIVITPEQIQTFETIRIILVILLIIAFVLAIIALGMHKAKKKRGEKNIKVCKPFAVVGLVFAILGILTAAGMLLILGNLGV